MSGLKYFNGTEWVGGGEDWVPKPPAGPLNGLDVFKGWTWMTELPDIDFSRLTNGQNMFSGTALNQPLVLDLEEALITSSMFQGVPIPTVELYLPKAATTSSMFQNNTALTEAYVAPATPENLVGYVLTMTSMFLGCSNLETIAFDTLWGDYTGSVHLGNMFYNCTNLQQVIPEFSNPLAGAIDLSGITSSEFPVNTSYMFYNCSSLTTARVRVPTHATTSQMFRGCSSLQEVELTFNNTGALSSSAGAFFSTNSPMTEVSFSGYNGRSGGGVTSAPLNFNALTSWSENAWAGLLGGLAYQSTPHASATTVSKTVYCGALQSIPAFTNVLSSLSSTLTAAGWIINTTTTTLPTS